MEFAKRMAWLEDNSLVEAMSTEINKEMISFAGGFPSSETYPVEAISQSFQRVMEAKGKEALSYCSTQGYGPLREKMRQRMKEKFQVVYEPDEIIMISGSQQGLDMSGMLFVDEQDVVLFEAPSYLGAVNALRAYQAQLVSVPTDETGMVIEDLKRALEKYGKRVKMIYVNPDFQNPTGRSWSEERRRSFMNLMAEYDIPVLEDGAYGELSFDGNFHYPLAYYDQKGQVIYIGTFSKIFCPGLRVAWLCAKKPIMEKYLILKSTADLSSSTISQMQMDDFLTYHDLDGHIREISRLYGQRYRVMAKALEEYFPENIQISRPTGGLFVWVVLPQGKDAKELLALARQKNVTFVPGAAFYPSGAKKNEFRLNFSNLKEESIREGIAILGQVVKDYLSLK